MQNQKDATVSEDKLIVLVSCKPSHLVEHVRTALLQAHLLQSSHMPPTQKVVAAHCASPVHCVAITATNLVNIKREQVALPVKKRMC